MADQYDRYSRDELIRILRDREDSYRHSKWLEFMYRR